MQDHRGAAGQELRRRVLLGAGGAALAMPFLTTRARAATTMKVAYATGEDYYHHKAALVFKDSVERATKGQLAVQLFPDSQLGGETQILEGVKAGTIEAFIGSNGALANFVPEAGILDLPYLFRDYAHVFSVTDGEVGGRLKAAAEAKGLTLAGFWPAGRRDIYGNVRIAKPDDLHGVKIRCLPSPVYVATFKAFGAIVVPLAWPEIYGALQQGVIASAESALTAAIAASQQEVIKFVSLTGHGLTVASFAVGSRWFGRLGDDAKQAILEGERLARAQAVKLDGASLTDAIDLVRKGGKTVIEPDLAAFKQIVQDSVYPQFKTRFDLDLVNQIARG